MSGGSLSAGSLLILLLSLSSRVSAGCLGAGVGAGSCPAPPFRALTEDIDHMEGCPAWAECCTEYGYCHTKSAWLAGEFRDCNGESNGTPLPLETRQKEAICSGEATEEDFAAALSDGSEILSDNNAKYSNIPPTSSSLTNIGLPPLDDFPSTSVSSIGSSDGLYLSPGSSRQGRKESSKIKRPTPSGFKKQNSFTGSSVKKTLSRSKQLDDRMITEILHIKNGFASFNRDTSNTRNWSGWRGISSNSSRTNGFKIRRGRFRKVNSNTKDMSQLDLSEESRSLRNHNGSCKWDLVRGGCRLLNSTSTILQRLPKRLPNRISIGKVNPNGDVRDIFMRCEKEEGCHKGSVKVTTEESIRKEDINERPWGNLHSIKTITKQPLSKKQSKDTIKNLIGLKTNRFNTNGFKKNHEIKDKFTTQRQEIINFVENKSANKIRKTISQVNKRIEGTKSVLDNVKIIEHETRDKEDSLKKNLPGKNIGGRESGRLSKSNVFRGGNSRVNYPIGRNGWAGPKPNCAWDGPGGCLKKKNKSKKKNNRNNNKSNIRQGKTVIETKPIFNIIRDEIEKKENNNNGQVKKIIEKKNTFNIFKEENENKKDEKEVNVVIEKSRFINLFPKRLKPLDFKNLLLANQSKTTFEQTTERIIKSSNKNKNEFDKSKLFPGKTIRERIKENLRQRARERNKLVGFTTSTNKPKPKNPSFTITTLKPKAKKSSPTKSKKETSTARKNKKEKKNKQKQREGRVGFEIWSVKEWLRRG